MSHLRFGKLPMQEERQTIGSLIKLKAETKQEAIRVVQRLHRNLGHPGPEALPALLAARGALEAVIHAAKGYICTACAKYKKPAQTAPASMPKAKEFNAVVQADVFWIRRGSTKYPILSLVDTATRYTAAILLKNEQSEQYIRAVERAWISLFGPPAALLTDEGRPWLGQDMDDWTTAHNIEHIVAPDEAHERLAVVERRHAVIRRAVEIYLDDQKIDDAPGIKAALTHNATPSVAGFSPTQWVLGHQPGMAGDLLSEHTQAPHFGGNSTFEDTLTKRQAPKKALIDADVDRRVRRALSLKYKGVNAEYSLGQKVWFWHDDRQETLSFAPWRTRHQQPHTPYGPAPDNTSHTTAAAAAQATQTATPPAGEQLPGQAFQVEDLDPKLLPAGWHVDDQPVRSPHGLLGSEGRMPHQAPPRTKAREDEYRPPAEGLSGSGGPARPHQGHPDPSAWWKGSLHDR